MLSDGLKLVDLKMGDTPIERAYEKVQLGIRMRFFRDGESSNDHGYELEWRGKEPLARTARRLQDMMYIWGEFPWEPSFFRTCVQSYVVVRLQYGSALYWLRGTMASRSK